MSNPVDGNLPPILSERFLKSLLLIPLPRDGDFPSLFKDVSLSANFSLPSACAVSQVVMGYNVSLQVSMSSSAAKQVSDLYSRTTSAGGSLSILGSKYTGSLSNNLAMRQCDSDWLVTVPIGGGAQHESSKTTEYSIKGNENSFSSFSIAGEDSGHPVVLGVVGRKLQPLGKAK